MKGSKIIKDHQRSSNYQLSSTPNCDGKAQIGTCRFQLGWLCLRCLAWLKKVGQFTLRIIDNLPSSKLARKYIIIQHQPDPSISILDTTWIFNIHVLRVACWMVKSGKTMQLCMRTINIDRVIFELFSNFSGFFFLTPPYNILKNHLSHLGMQGTAHPHLRKSDLFAVHWMQPDADGTSAETPAILMAQRSTSHSRTAFIIEAGRCL